MLKKLVKYGNSNAIVLDKAILELLNIAEGSILKIRTDGKSLILTPQERAAPEEIHETYNSDAAWLDVRTKETSKRYNLSEESTKEVFELYKKFNKLHEELIQNVDFFEQTVQLKKLFSDTPSSEYLEAYKALRGKFSPELARIEKELTSFAPVDSTQIKTMEQEFAAVFKKYPEAFISYNAFLNNSEYQHQMQLIAEEYKTTGDSTKYMEAIEAIQNKYSPETQELRDAIKAIGKKHETIKSV